MQLYIFNSLYQKERKFFEEYNSVLSVLNDSDEDTLKNIFSSNIKIIYDRSKKEQQSAAYKLMNELVETGQVEFVTDVLYTTRKNPEGKTVSIPLPKDRIILKFK